MSAADPSAGPPAGPSAGSPAEASGADASVDPAQAGAACARDGAGAAAHAGAPAPPVARLWTWTALLGLAALLLRLPTLSSRSLWLDETYSAWFAAVPLRELWTGVPLYETHPPFYYTLLKVWIALFGTGEAAMRSLSVLAGVLAVVLLPACARLARLGARAERVALLAALLLALNANAILFAQQARPYALQTLAGSLAVFCSGLLLAALAGLHQPSGPVPAGAAARPAPRADRRLWPAGAGLALAAGATLWLHNTGVFAVFAIWTGMVAGLLAAPGVRSRPAMKRALLALALSGLGALLVWSPFIPMLVRQNAAMAKLAFWVRFQPSNVVAAWTVISGARALHYPAAALVLAGFHWLWRHARPLCWHLACVLALPVLALAAYSQFVKPVFLSRLFEWLAPLGMVLMALGVASLRARWQAAALALVLGLSAWSVIGFYRSHTENWREMLARLARESRPGDLVVALPNEVQMPVTYYLPRDLAARVAYLPAPFPALGLARRYTGNSGAPAVAPEDVLRLRGLLQGRRRVWLIERRADLYDPDGVVTRELRRAYRAVGSIDGSGANITLYVGWRGLPSTR